jgi:hypothetical protein
MKGVDPNVLSNTTLEIKTRGYDVANMDSTRNVVTNSKHSLAVKKEFENESLIQNA